MRIGVSTAQCGRLASSAAVRAAAVAAEQVGYSSIWVLDRLLAPIAPNEGYDGGDHPVPEKMRPALEPLAVLSMTAAVTSQVRLGTSVLVAPWYPPALLARALTTLDVLSDGRLTVGLGTGWSTDELAAVGVAKRGLGAKLEETLDVLDAYWGDEPVIAYDGKAFAIPPSHNALHPVQRPRPPVLLAAYTPSGLDRVARRADGWMPTGLAVDVVAPMWAQVRDLAAQHGRDPAELQLVVRASIVLTDAPIDGERASYCGSVDQVADDIDATRTAGADEVILSVSGDVSLDQALDAYARIAEEAGVRAAAAAA